MILAIVHGLKRISLRLPRFFGEESDQALMNIAGVFEVLKIDSILIFRSAQLQRFLWKVRKLTKLQGLILLRPSAHDFDLFVDVNDLATPGQEGIPRPDVLGEGMNRTIDHHSKETIGREHVLAYTQLGSMTCL
ncbi:hypothetical protein BGZ83_003990, partial [Gryganskiella cystojenkinii]